MNLGELLVLMVVVAIDLVLGSIVLIRNSRSWSNRLFALTALSMVAWLVSNFLCDQPMFYAHALEFNRLSVGMGALMGVPLIALTVSFPAARARVSWWWRFALLGLAGLAVVTLLTNSIVESIQVESWGTNIVQGWLFPFLTMWGLFLCLMIVVTLTRKYSAARSRQKTQFKFLFIGMASFAVAAVLLGAIIPAITSSNELAKLSPLATILFLAPTSYAIIRHRLMDIGFVALRGTIYALLVATLGGLFLVVLDAGGQYATARLGLDSHWVLFVGGLLAILGFQPVRATLVGMTNRFFYRRAYDPDRLLGQLGRLIASTLDPHELATQLTQDLADEMRLSFAAVLWWRGDVPEIAQTHCRFSEADTSRLLGLCRQGSILMTDELEPVADEAVILADCGVRVLAPLLSENAVLGAIVLGEKRSGAMYSSADWRFLGILTSEAAIALKNAQLFDEKAQRVRELTALNRLSLAVGADIDLDAILDRALHEIVTVTKADAGSIMLLDDVEQVLRISSALGVSEDAVDNARVAVGQGIAGWVAATKEALILVDDTDPRFKGELNRHDIVSAICAPIIAKDKVIGVLNLTRKRSPELFTRETLHVVTTFAGQLGAAIENARLYGDLESTFLGTISALAAAVDAKDPYTFGHSNEVTIHAVALAKKLGLSEEEVRTIRIAATLHDIGKIGIDGSILNKPGRLTEEERAVVNRHPAIGADILASLDFLRDTVPLVLFHHERFGGAGYPSGVSGEAIPMGARIISVADSYNAMVSDRPYREGMSVARAIKELRDHAGTQFDPELVESFVEIIAEEVGPEEASPEEASPEHLDSEASRDSSCLWVRTR